MLEVLAFGTGQPTNAILARLPPRQRTQMVSACELVSLEPDQELIRAGEPISHVYFLESGAAALVGGDGDLKGVDLALVGPENMIGVQSALVRGVPDHGAVMRVKGSAHRLPRAVFEQALERVDGLREICLERADALLGLALRSAGCYAHHRLGPRLARWILAVADRAGTEEFAITHERLAVALGVRRAGVTMAIHELEGQRLIRSTRCRLSIRDRSGLAATACACYRPTHPHRPRAVHTS